MMINENRTLAELGSSDHQVKEYSREACIEAWEEEYRRLVPDLNSKDTVGIKVKSFSDKVIRYRHIFTPDLSNFDDRPPVELAEIISGGNKMIIGGKGMGKTHTLIAIGDRLLQEKIAIPIYLDLNLVNRAIIRSLESDLEQQLKFFCFRGLISEPIDLISRGDVALLLDNLADCSDDVLEDVRYFCRNFNQYSRKPNKIFVTCSKEIELIDNSFSCLTLSPWSGKEVDQFFNWQITPSFSTSEVRDFNFRNCVAAGFRDRFIAQPVTPGLCAMIQEIRKYTGIIPQNLAQIYSLYLPKIYAQAEKILAEGAKQKLGNLRWEKLMLELVDSRYESLEFSQPEIFETMKLFYSKCKLDTTLIPYESLWEALLRSGLLVKDYLSGKYHFLNSSFHYYFAAKTYDQQYNQPNPFQKDVTQSLLWQPILPFYLELKPLEDREAIAQELIDKIIQMDNRPQEFDTILDSLGSVIFLTQAELARITS